MGTIKRLIPIPNKEEKVLPYTRERVQLKVREPMLALQAAEDLQATVLFENPRIHQEAGKQPRQEKELQQAQEQELQPVQEPGPQPVQEPGLREHRLPGSPPAPEPGNRLLPLRHRQVQT